MRGKSNVLKTSNETYADIYCKFCGGNYMQKYYPDDIVSGEPFVLICGNCEHQDLFIVQITQMIMKRYHFYRVIDKEYMVLDRIKTIKNLISTRNV